MEDEDEYGLQMTSDEALSLMSLSPSNVNTSANTFLDIELQALKDLWDSTNGNYWTYGNQPKFVPWNFDPRNISAAKPCNSPFNNWDGVVCSCPSSLNQYVADSSCLSMKVGNVDSSTGENTDDAVPCDINSNIPVNDSAFNYPLLMGKCVIRRLILPGRNLVGTLPSSLSQLKYLQVLVLANNSLRSTISESVYTLTMLNSLDLSRNQLTGTISPSISKLSSLRILKLANNSLSGIFPLPSITTNLIELSLSFNSLRGSFQPQYMSEFTRLKILMLRGNLFDGGLPLHKNMTKLYSFWISRNSFEGYFPDYLPSFKSLTYFAVNNNSLYGQIHSNIGELTQLTTLKLGRNFFTGFFEDSITKLTKLTYLNLDQNRLRGPIPNGISALVNLRRLVLDAGYFTGTIPSSMSALTNLRYLQLEQNQFMGSIPASFSSLVSLKSLKLRNNQLNARLPPELGKLKNLTFLDIAGNAFNGPIPPEWGGMTRMRHLDISFNKLKGTVPDALMNLRNLTLLFIANNTLTGPFGEWLDRYGKKYHSLNIENVDCSNNNITGRLPTTFFSAASRRLTMFAAVGNCWEISVGDSNTATYLPQDMCYAKNLKTLVLDALTSMCPRKTTQYFVKESVVPIKGPIPDCLFNLSKLALFRVSGNALKGSFKKDLVISSSLTRFAMPYNYYSGEIPYSMQSKKWELLDLSYNRFGGELSAEASRAIGDAAIGNIVKLKANRLSGIVTKSFLSVPEADILTANLFFCPYGSASHTRNNYLPQHDPSYSSYNCGSNTFNLVIFFWSCILLIFIVSLLAMAARGNISPLVINSNPPLPGKKWPYWDNLMGAWENFHDLLSYSQKVAFFSSPVSVTPEPEASSSSSSSRSEQDSMVVGDASGGCDNKIDTPTPPITITTSNQSMKRKSKKDVMISNRITKGMISSIGHLYHIQEFGKICQNLRFVCVFLAVLSVVILLPIFYVLEKNGYKLYLYSYGWAFSGAFFGGRAVGDNLTYLYMILFIILVFICMAKFQAVTWYKKGNETLMEKDRSRKESAITDIYKEPAPIFNSTSKCQKHFSSISQFLTAFDIIMVNCLAVSVINFGYVFLVQRVGKAPGGSPATLGLLQIFVAGLKFWWNEVGLISLLRYYKHKSLYLFATLGIVNYILIPILGIMLVSPRCFSAKVLPQPPVVQELNYTESIISEQYSYQYIRPSTQDHQPGTDTNVVTYGLAGLRPPAISTFSGVSTTTFFPHFQYSYECSSAIITEYSAVYISMFAFTTFIYPLCIFVAVVAHARAFRFSGLGSDWYRLLDPYIPVIMKTFTLGEFNSKEAIEYWKHGVIRKKDFGFFETNAKIFERNIFVVKNVTRFAVLITFGMLCPPVAMACTLAVLSDTIVNQLLVGRFCRQVVKVIEETHTLRKVLLRLMLDMNRQAKGIGRVTRNTVMYTIPMSSIFYSLFLFDAIGGDKDGGRVEGLTRALIFSCVCIVFFIVSMFMQMYFFAVETDSAEDELSGIIGDHADEHDDADVERMLAVVNPLPGHVPVTVNPLSHRLSAVMLKKISTAGMPSHHENT